MSAYAITIRCPGTDVCYGGNRGAQRRLSTSRSTHTWSWRELRYLLWLSAYTRATGCPELSRLMRYQVRHEQEPWVQAGRKLRYGPMRAVCDVRY
eukprot:2976770-Rhodomonas_salina.2